MKKSKRRTTEKAKGKNRWPGQKKSVRRREKGKRGVKLIDGSVVDLQSLRYRFNSYLTLSSLFHSRPFFLFVLLPLSD